MAQVKQLMIICGEASGELHAANLTQAILQINPEIKISAVGGTLLRQAGAEVFYNIKDLAVIGFFDVFKKLPKFLYLKKLILEKIKEKKPDAIILVDFSGFNLRLAKKINKTIPTIYYISPQVWASRSGRIKTIKKYIHQLIVLFKFEEEFYKRYGIDVDFVGHPLLDIVQPTMEKKEFLIRFGLSESKTTLALLPGSRQAEIENILPVMLETCQMISRDITDVQFVIAKSETVSLDIYNRQISQVSLDLKIIEGKTYDCLHTADFCLVASGTATLETAIMQKPFVVIYKVNPLNYLFYLPQIKVPYLGMVNIVAGERVVPEFIQHHARPEKIASYIKETLTNPQALDRIKKLLSRVKNRLGEKGASQRAAKNIVDFLNKNESR